MRVDKGLAWVLLLSWINFYVLSGAGVVGFLFSTEGLLSGLAAVGVVLFSFSLFAAPILWDYWCGGLD